MIHLKNIDKDAILNVSLAALGAIGGVSFALVAAIPHAISCLLLSVMGTALNRLNQKEEGVWPMEFLDESPYSLLTSVVDIVRPSKGVFFGGGKKVAPEEPMDKVFGGSEDSEVFSSGQMADSAPVHDTPQNDTPVNH